MPLRQWVPMLDVLLLSVVGCAVVGWGTNALAVRMLFRPYRPWRVGPWCVQGVFPRRQREVARRLGDLTARDLLPPAQLGAAVAAPAVVEAVRREVLCSVSERLEEAVERAPGALTGLGHRLVGKVREAVDRELASRLPGFMEQMAVAAAGEIDVARRVEEQVGALPPERLEAMLVQTLRQEFRFVEGVGAVVGGAVGLLQGLLWIAVG